MKRRNFVKSLFMIPVVAALTIELNFTPIPAVKSLAEAILKNKEMLGQITNLYYGRNSTLKTFPLSILTKEVKDRS